MNTTTVLVVKAKYQYVLLQDLVAAGVVSLRELRRSCENASLTTVLHFETAFNMESQ